MTAQSLECKIVRIVDTVASEHVLKQKLGEAGHHTGSDVGTQDFAEVRRRNKELERQVGV